MGVGTVIGTGDAPNPHLAPLSTGYLCHWLGMVWEKRQTPLLFVWGTPKSSKPLLESELEPASPNEMEWGDAGIPAMGGGLSQQVHSGHGDKLEGCDPDSTCFSACVFGFPSQSLAPLAGSHSHLEKYEVLDGGWARRILCPGFAGR